MRLMIAFLGFVPAWTRNCGLLCSYQPFLECFFSCLVWVVHNVVKSIRGMGRDEWLSGAGSPVALAWRDP